MEVFLKCTLFCTCIMRLLHARGGVSEGMYISTFDSTVFSTPVEVFPSHFTHAEGFMGLLHARGGVSTSKRYGLDMPKSSPRPWRCFLLLKMPCGYLTVFSTPVEVFLERVGIAPDTIRLLHARGGVSISKLCYAKL